MIVWVSVYVPCALYLFSFCTAGCLLSRWSAGVRRQHARQHAIALLYVHACTGRHMCVCVLRV